jgi:hypothetical protein
MRDLTGLRFSIEVEPLVAQEKDGERKMLRRAEESLLLEIPQFQVCEATGNGPAEEQVPSTAGWLWVSQTVRQRREAYQRFRDKESHDIIGLIDPQLPEFDLQPDDFHEMCGDEYLAVIHADGNDIGKKSKAARGPKPANGNEADLIAWEAKGESFFHATRVAVRRAVKEALEATFNAGPKIKHRPYQLLMLGGDDLLLVCRAKPAMRFVVRYARALRDSSHELYARAGHSLELTVGAGIVIAPPTMPFHHLHHVAETLAGSAKRLYRCLKSGAGREASVADWLIATGSWSGNPIELRRNTEIVRYKSADGVETLALTRRPLQILKAEDENVVETAYHSLEGLIEAADRLGEAVKNGKVARSQLRWLDEEVRRGRRWGETALEQMPEEARKVLESALQLKPSSLWTDAGERRWATSLPDLVEIFEIARLATAR